ncbi:reverse transcriptase domain-containing protein [Tanacetum coccineum]
MMADQRTVAELLCAPTEGYAEAIVVPPILAEHFELKHSLINMMTSDQFFGLEKDNPHNHIRWFNKITSTIKYKDVPNSAIKLMLFPFSLAGVARRWLEKEPPRSILTWEDLVSKFINEFFPPSRTINLRNEISNFEQCFGESFHEAWDRYKDLLRACLYHGFTELHQLDTFYNALNPTNQDSLNSAAGVKSSDVNSSSPSEIAKLTHAVNQQTSAVTTSMTAIFKQFQATPPPASVKAVEEICVTCGGAHLDYQCLAANGNTFWDNIQGYVSAAAVNYNQASISNQTNELKNMMASFFQMNTASTSGTGSLPSNTIANPKGELKAITTRSGLVLDGPSIPMPPPFINPEEDERVEETLMDPELGEFTIKDPPPLVQKAKPTSLKNYVVQKRDPLHPNIPYPSRMHQEKQQEKDEVQIHKFWQMFKQLHINITLADALILIPKYQKMLKSLLSNKEKLLELANIPLNENCSAVIIKKLPEKQGDLGKFLIPCGFSELKYKALADLGASINLMPLSRNRIFANNDPTKEMDSILEDSVDEGNLVDTIPEMFSDEHTLDYSSPPLYDDVDDDLVELESDNDNVYDDPFDSKEDKIKESKLLIDELDPPRSSDFLPLPKCDSVFYEDFSKVDALPSTDNEEKVFNPGILIHENLFEITIHVTPDKNVKKLSSSNASLILEDFNPPLYGLLFHKEVPGSETLLSFSSEK